MQEVESAYMRRKAAVKGDSCRVTGGDGKGLEALLGPLYSEGMGRGGGDEATP